MPPQQHPYEEMGDALAEWIESVSDELAEALRDGGRAPFEARVTKAQQLQYYDTAFFLPSGQPNMEGRQAELQRLGPQQYAKAMREVLNWRETQSVSDNPADDGSGDGTNDTPAPLDAATAGDAAGQRGY